MTEQQIIERLGPPNTDVTRPSLQFDDAMFARRADHLLYPRLIGDLLIRVWDGDGPRICFASQSLRRPATVEITAAVALIPAACFVTMLEVIRRWNRSLRNQPANCGRGGYDARQSL
jgi:hypothetical protein